MGHQRLRHQRLRRPGKEAEAGRKGGRPQMGPRVCAAAVRAAAPSCGQTGGAPDRARACSLGALLARRPQQPAGVASLATALPAAGRAMMAGASALPVGAAALLACTLQDSVSPSCGSLAQLLSTSLSAGAVPAAWLAPALQRCSKQQLPCGVLATAILLACDSVGKRDRKREGEMLIHLMLSNCASRW